MKLFRQLTGAVALAGILLCYGCEDHGDGPGSVMPDRLTGPAGQSVSVSGLAKGAGVPCRAVSGDIWSFDVGFATGPLDGKYKAQLLVEIDKDSEGQAAWGGNRGPYVQPSPVSAGPGAAGGTLKGRLGPPVSAKVRFAVAVRLIDTHGTVVAVSETVGNLKPVL